MLPSPAVLRLLDGDCMAGFASPTTISYWPALFIMWPGVAFANFRVMYAWPQ